jgi:photosystem II stability/assembly factor-like uncharacterized protein
MSLAADGRNGDLFVGTGSMHKLDTTYASLGVLRSTDAGKTLQMTFLSTPRIAYSLLSDAASGILYAGSDFSYMNYYGPVPSGGSVYRSADQGQTWAKSETDLGDSVTALGRSPGGGVLYAGTGLGDFFESLDGGDHWLLHSRLPGSVNGIAIDPKAPDRIYAATSGAGVQRSSDRGASWESFNAGLPSLVATSLAIDPTGRALHAGTSFGVFDIQLGPDTPPGLCVPGADHLCFFGSRFRIDIAAIDPTSGGTVDAVAVSQATNFGYFSFPGLTGDARMPEVLVKMVDARAVANGGFWFFYSGLTSLLYTLRVTDTVSGMSREFLGQNFCGAADTASFPVGPGSASAPSGERSSLVGAGDELRLFSGRFRITLTAEDPFTGAALPGLAIAQDDRFGYFSLPGLTGYPDFPEVAVKMIDGTSLPGGHFWIFYSGLTSTRFTLKVEDAQTGEVRPYQNDPSDPTRLCGGADTTLSATGSPPTSSTLVGKGRFTWLTAEATSRSLCPEITNQIGDSWVLYATLRIAGTSVTLEVGEEPDDRWVYRGTIEAGTIRASGNPGFGFACPGDSVITPQTGSDLTGTLSGRSLSGRWVDTYGQGDAAVRFGYSFEVTFEN